jgi:hypothetical protein
MNVGYDNTASGAMQAQRIPSQPCLSGYVDEIERLVGLIHDKASRLDGHLDHVLGFRPPQPGSQLNEVKPTMDGLVPRLGDRIEGLESAVHRLSAVVERALSI